MQRPSEDAITANVIDNIVLKEVRTEQILVYLAQIADKLSSKHCFAPVLGVITIPKGMRFLIAVLLRWKEWRFFRG